VPEARAVLAGLSRALFEVRLCRCRRRPCRRRRLTHLQSAGSFLAFACFPWPATKPALPGPIPPSSRLRRSLLARRRPASVAVWHGLTDAHRSAQGRLRATDAPAAPTRSPDFLGECGRCAMPRSEYDGSRHLLLKPPQPWTCTRRRRPSVLPMLSAEPTGELFSLELPHSPASPRTHTEGFIHYIRYLSRLVMLANRSLSHRRGPGGCSGSQVLSFNCISPSHRSLSTKYNVLFASAGIPHTFPRARLAPDPSHATTLTAICRVCHDSTTINQRVLLTIKKAWSALRAVSRARTTLSSICPRQTGRRQAAPTTRLARCSSRMRPTDASMLVGALAGAMAYGWQSCLTKLIPPAKHASAGLAEFHARLAFRCLRLLVLPHDAASSREQNGSHHRWRFGAFFVSAVFVLGTVNFGAQVAFVLDAFAGRGTAFAGGAAAYASASAALPASQISNVCCILMVLLSDGLLVSSTRG
jgi:hypothetical protein